MGSGKQWSDETVRQVKAMIIIGLPLPRIATQTGVVLQTLRSFSARVKEGYTRDKHSSHLKQTDEMKHWVSDHLIAKQKSSVTEVHVDLWRSGFDLLQSTWRLSRSQHRPVRPIRTHKICMLNYPRMRSH